jgi:hypothetical protein
MGVSSQFEPLDNGEVISIADETALIFINHRTFRVGEFSDSVRCQLKTSAAWTDDKNSWFSDTGVPCEVLRFSSGSWQKGKVRIRLEFAPESGPADKPAVKKDKDEEESERVSDDFDLGGGSPIPAAGVVATGVLGGTAVAITNDAEDSSGTDEEVDFTALSDDDFDLEPPTIETQASQEDPLASLDEEFKIDEAALDAELAEQGEVVAEEPEEFDLGDGDIASNLASLGFEEDDDISIDSGLDNLANEDFGLGDGPAEEMDFGLGETVDNDEPMDFSDEAMGGVDFDQGSPESMDFGLGEEDELASMTVSEEDRNEVAATMSEMSDMFGDEFDLLSEDSPAEDSGLDFAMAEEDDVSAIEKELADALGDELDLSGEDVSAGLNEGLEDDALFQDIWTDLNKAP